MTKINFENNIFTVNEMKEIAMCNYEEQSTIDTIIEFAHKNMETSKAAELIKMILDFGFESECQGYSAGYDQAKGES